MRDYLSPICYVSKKIYFMSANQTDKTFPNGKYFALSEIINCSLPSKDVAKVFKVSLISSSTHA